MKLLLNNHGQRIETINVAGYPAGKRGTIEMQDWDGKYYVIWDDNTAGVIREREDSYRFISCPQKKVWYIKRLILILLRKIKRYEFK